MNNKSDIVGVAICWVAITLAAFYLIAQILRGVI